MLLDKHSIKYAREDKYKANRERYHKKKGVYKALEKVKKGTGHGGKINIKTGKVKELY